MHYKSSVLKVISAICLLLFITASTKAQDTLYYKNGGAVAIVKVTEIGLETIKYRSLESTDAPIIEVAKQDLTKAVLADGTVILFVPDPMDQTPSAEAQKKIHCIKFEFFSPLLNKITFGYEQVIKPGYNLEGKIGIIGLGVVDNTRKASGVFVKGGVKILMGHDYYMRGQHPSHPLRGAYVKPELILNRYTQNWTLNSPTVDRVTCTNIAGQIVIGKQVLLGNFITLDYYVGMGYGWQESSKRSINNNGFDQETWQPYAYSHLFFGNSFPAIFTTGFTVGFIY